MRKIINLEWLIKNKTTREWVEALIFAIIFALIFRTWAYSPFRVPTGSMIPTIQKGDHLFANMHAYGFALPFTDIKFFPQDIERGDIVIFPYPEDPSLDFIKRVIAVGGDEVEIRRENVYINGKREELSSAYYDTARAPYGPPGGNTKFRVPDGKAWVMGDNRRNSKDSRSWGFVDLKTVKGKGLIIYWSHDPEESYVSGYRFNRIGNFLE